jgi:hypothetical protein
MGRVKKYEVKKTIVEEKKISRKYIGVKKDCLAAKIDCIKGARLPMSAKLRCI